MRYDLVVIGNTAEAHEAALVGARLKKKVALVEHIPVGTQHVAAAMRVPAGILREAVLAAVNSRGGARDNVPGERPGAVLRDLKRSVSRLIEAELDSLHRQFVRLEVDRYHGEAQFTGPNELVIGAGNDATRLEAETFVVATGTRAERPDRIPFDGQRVFGPDDFLNLGNLPRSLFVVGAGVTGIEQALLFAALGVKVTVIDGCEKLLEGFDRDVVDVLMFYARSLKVEFRLGEDVIGVDEAAGNRIALVLVGGRKLVGESVLYATGRIGNTDRLNLAAVGIVPDERGRLWCDDNLRTWTPNIYAAGDVVGFPSLAAVAVEQGRRAVCHALGFVLEGWQKPVYALPTAPDIQMTGMTEDQLRKERFPYEVGLARVGRMGPGLSGSAATGLVKLLFDPLTRKVLGAHGIGDAAADAVVAAASMMARDETLVADHNLAGAADALDDLIPQSLLSAVGDGMSKLFVHGRHDAALPGSIRRGERDGVSALRVSSR